VLRAAGDVGSFEIPVLKHQYSAEVAGCKIFAIQNAKTEILVLGIALISEGADGR
jgi:hypothetical protein